MVEEKDVNGFASICGFPSATKIYCTARANNSVGMGPSVAGSVYTQLAGKVIILIYAAVSL